MGLQISESGLGLSAGQKMVILLQLLERIIVIDKGHVAMDGPRDALMAQLSR